MWLFKHLPKWWILYHLLTILSLNNISVQKLSFYYISKDYIYIQQFKYPHNTKLLIHKIFSYSFFITYLWKLYWTFAFRMFSLSFLLFLGLFFLYLLALSIMFVFLTTSQTDRCVRGWQTERRPPSEEQEWQSQTSRI